MSEQQPPGPAPVQPLGAPGSYLAPHRGTLILVLGILGLVPCCGAVLGIIAWVMGSTDLRAMREGRMDRSGEGLTNAGCICGIIGVIIGVIVFFIAVAGFAFGILRAAHHPYYR